MLNPCYRRLRGESFDYIIYQRAAKANKRPAFEIGLIRLVQPIEVTEDLFLGQILFFAHRAHLWHRYRAWVEFVAIVVVIRHKCSPLSLFCLAVKKRHRFAGANLCYLGTDRSYKPGKPLGAIDVCFIKQNERTLPRSLEFIGDT